MKKNQEALIDLRRSREEPHQAALTMTHDNRKSLTDQRGPELLTIGNELDAAADCTALIH